MPQGVRSSLSYQGQTEDNTMNRRSDKLVVNWDATEGRVRHDRLYIPIAIIVVGVSLAIGLALGLLWS